MAIQARSAFQLPGEARFDWTESLAAGPCLDDEFRTCHGAVDEDHHNHSGFVAAGPALKRSCANPLKRSEKV